MATAAKTVVCLCVLLCVSQVCGSHIPAEMNRTIQNLLQHYKIPNSARFNGKPVFPKQPPVGNMELKQVFMGGVLETYEQLIGRMLNQLPTPSPLTTGGGSDAAAVPGAREDVRTDLNYVLKKIQKLKEHRYQEQTKLLQGLRDLRLTQMDNSVVQSKALWELTWLYEEASEVSNQIQRRRSRRQARRLKTPPTA